MKRQRMVVFCVDGGVARVVREHGLFDLGKRVRGLPVGPVGELRTIFPSSTAPAHASFLTGTHPERHGILGNRFWSGEPVEEIRRRMADPLRTLHPYTRSALTSPSLLDWFADRDASVAAVQFPQTFGSDLGEGQPPALYCLYAPATTVTVPLSRRPDGGADGSASVAYFGEPLRLEVSRTADPSERADITLTVQGVGRTVRLPEHATERIDTHNVHGGLSFSVTVARHDAGCVVLELGTCVLSLCFGGLDRGVVADLDGPASLGIEYTANPDHTFSEAPRAEWITAVTLRVIERFDPDVLFVRFNQADHAQEYLYWHATRGPAAEAELAKKQILGAYRTIDEQVGVIAEAVGPDADYVFFSDHGIDWVETHIRPNEALTELGLDQRMIFQGDSNCAFLYSDERPGERELRAVAEQVRRLDPSIRVLSDADLHALRLPTSGPRIGHLAITSGEHTEFQYSVGPGRETVRSASHGFRPTSSAMSGFARLSGPNTTGLTLPGELVAMADVVRGIWLRGGGKA